MEPDVIRIYSSSPPPMEDGAEEEDNEFGDFGTFSGVPNSISFTEFDTPTTFNQSQALTATSPPELINNRAVMGFSHSSSNGTYSPGNELSKANGVVPAGHLGSGPSERTEMKKVLSGSVDVTVSDTAGSEPADCNGGGTEVLTNGFATFDFQGSPSLQNSVHSHLKGTSTEDTDSVPAGSPEDDFADFAAFSNAEGHLSQTANEDFDNPTGGSWPAEPACPVEHCNIVQGTPSEDNVRDANRTGSDSGSISVPAEDPDGSCNTDRGSHTDADSQQRDVAFAQEDFASEAVCTNKPLTLNRVDVADRDDSKEGCSENDLSPDAAGDGEMGQSDGKGSGNDTETETETETSFGRVLSTDALEEYGDMSTTGSVPSPPLLGETATPADHSQLAEDEEDEDFGDFGDAGLFSSQGFADFDQLDVQQEQSRPHSSAPAQEATNAKDDDDFGDFNSPKFHTGGNEGEDGGKFAEFPVSDSFGNFSSAAEGADGEADAGWSAFGEPQQQQQVEGESWAAFSTEPSVAPPAESREQEEEDEEEDEEEEWHESEPPAACEEVSRTDRQPASLSSRLEKLFQSSFPQTAVPSVEDEVASLKILLGPPEEKPQPGVKEEKRSPCNRSVWTQLQDIHEAIGLRYQWGGSHCNKALLCCLGIDTRNILFTGQKKQPVIVPMYAASLGMLEPTKEPVKPVSAAEMIASIAQAPSVAPEKSSCPSDTVQQEALPPVQFDWSSSGLTNPLDASGGSSLLNLDFFGPVEDSGSTSSPSIPGVDPELFELTTAKLDPGSSSSRVADAFARLMSTMEKTSTSTRKPRKEENLSEEAAKVIAALPDLSFMQAKVLMFPATLTPLGSQATPD
ncbi:aftiphilin a isoform X1 [Larimichthys crocea]|uniref:aftiphilin a isoform X1 n=1 Tax=Larimichthys crocea TaxID=215358 RepID=UPI000F5F52B5|nr:aftiphilin isoform X1 [Larimichthys crocea]XP_019115284.2 aftiphilin isoform X1 [Larimichthys crocea]XP_027139075.1 aftiphilin isoform X1 [Larimichthys crocea]